MTKKRIFKQLQNELQAPAPKTEQLFLALSLPMPEEKPTVKERTKLWIPAVALTCTAAITMAICLPVYLNSQGSAGIISGVNSAAAEEKKLVWSIGGSTCTNKSAVVTGPIDKELQKAMDDPANEGKLFCISAMAPLTADENFVFEGESMASIDQKIAQIFPQMTQIQYELYAPYESYVPMEVVNQYAEAVTPLMELREQYEKQKEKIRIASLKAQLEELKKQLPSDIKISAVEETSDLLEYGSNCYSEVTKDQIEQLVTLGFKVCPTIPARVEGYDRRIADSLVAMLEYEPQETYFVRVNSVLCKRTEYGNENYNADLIRELKDEEITQEFGDNFLAAIRERHGIEDAYVPTYGIDIRWISKTQANKVDILKDWYVPGDAPGESHIYLRYNGGFFEAKLTREEILELAEDSDVRSIYPASSEYEYYLDNINS